MNTSNIIATIGVSTLLIAFLLLTIKRLKSDGLAYNILNLVGAILTGYSSYLIQFYPLVILEGVWALVSIFGIYKALEKVFHVKTNKNV